MTVHLILVCSFMPMPTVRWTQPGGNVSWLEYAGGGRLVMIGSRVSAGAVTGSSTPSIVSAIATSGTGGVSFVAAADVTSHVLAKTFAGHGSVVVRLTWLQ